MQTEHQRIPDNRYYVNYLTKSVKQQLGVKNADEKTYCLGFPTYREGRLSGFNMWLGDKMPDRYRPKYKYTPNGSVIVWDFILNPDDKNRRLFVIEGVFDALRLIAAIQKEGKTLP